MKVSKQKMEIDVNIKLLEKEFTKRSSDLKKYLNNFSM